MQQVQLTDELYKTAQRRAHAAGFSSVDEYVSNILSQELSNEVENFDHLFTPERLAHIDAAMAEVRAGNFYTSEEVSAELAKQRAEWHRKNIR